MAQTAMIETLRQHRNQLLIATVLLIVLIGGSLLIQNWRTSLRQGQLADYLTRAEAAEEEESYQQAFDLYAQALTIEPQNTTALTGLGDVAFAVGDYQTSVQYYQQAGQNERAEAHYYLALKAMGEIDLDAAIKELTVAQQQVSTASVLPPSKVDALKEQLQNIIQEENAALQKAQLGRVLIEEKAPELAIQALEPLVQEEPDYRDAHYLLGAAYYQAGEVGKAKTELEATLEIDANYEPAKTLLEQVQ